MRSSTGPSRLPMYERKKYFSLLGTHNSKSVAAPPVPSSTHILTLSLNRITTLSGNPLVTA